MWKMTGKEPFLSLGVTSSLLSIMEFLIKDLVVTEFHSKDNLKFY